MKSKLIQALMLFISYQGFSQMPNKKIFLDSLDHETNEINHKYYRIVKDYYSDLPKKIYLVSEYYKSGKVRMTGTSKSKEYVSGEGQFIYYYENGNKKNSTYFKDGYENGNYAEWYENGNPKLEGEYSHEEKARKSKLKILEYWNTDNILKVTGGNGDYEENTNEESGHGKIKDGFKDGVWIGNNKRIKYSYTETYTEKVLVSGVSIDSNKVERTYKILEIFPEPKKGQDDFYKHVMRNFIPPDNLKVGGKVFISFVIDEEGNSTQPKIIRSVRSDVDLAAINVITSYKDWIPGESRGIKVKTTFSLPIMVHPTE